MARKPKSWTDNPLGEINKLYNAVMPGGRDVTEPQSLAQFKDVVRNTATGTVKAADLYTTGGLGVSFAQNLILPAATIASKETRTAAASKGMTQFAKDAAITAASAGAGYVVGKAVSKGAAKVVESGIPARIANKVKGDIVVVHGTGRSVVGNTINPRAGSAYSPTEPAAFAWNTKIAKRSDVGLNAMHSNVQEYSTRPYYDALVGKEVPGQGNIVIGKTKMKDAISRLSDEGVIASKKPIKITKIIKEESDGSKVLQQRENFIKELKKAGVPVKPTPVKQMLDKVEQQKLLKRQRISNKNSAV